MLLNCPNCQSVWGFEEFQFQECDCCGYPDNIDDEDQDDEFNDEYDLPENLRTIKE